MIDKQHDQQDNDRLDEKLMMLDWDIEPGRDLWPDIANRIKTTRQDKESKFAEQSWIPYAMAASFLVAVVSLLFSYMNFDHSQINGDYQSTFVVYQQSQIELIEQQHQIVRMEFSQLLQNQREVLDPAFVHEVETTLRTIDKAAEELKMAMLEQPYNPNYSFMLVRAYQQEIKLLNKIRSKQDISI